MVSSCVICRRFNGRSHRSCSQACRNNDAKYLFNFSVSYEEAAQGVAGVHFGAFQSHHDVSVLLAVLCWPVLVTLPLQKEIRAQLMRDCIWTTTLRDVINVLLQQNLLCLFPPGWWSWWWSGCSAPKSSSKSPQTWTWEDLGLLYKLWAGCNPERME